MTPTFAHDRYEIVTILGRGGMGVVYLARDLQLERLVALKVVESDVLDGEARRRLESEARAVASIRHPNVATVYEVGQTADGLPFISMEYCEGATLAQVSREMVVERVRLLSIARQIASGLEAAHRAGLVHGDIKSANIILQPDGGIKILDFGLARRYDLRTSQDETTRMSNAAGFAGTLAYSSPEQLTARAVDHRSDLFSAGVVLYELSTGRLPFDHASPLMMMEQIRDGEPARFEPRDRALPEEFAAIIGRLLQKDPARRIQSSAALLEALAAVPDSPSGRKVSRSSAKLGRTSRRRYAPLFGTLAAVLAIVVLSMTMIERRGGPAAEPLRPIRSLAVLPFHTISSTEEDEFLSVGLADALATRLQQMPELLVRPTSSTLGFRQKLVDAQKAGRQLEVDGVLEGRIIAAGSTLRVNLQLIDSRTGYGIWAESVDGRRDDLLQLMDQISSRAAIALSRRLALEQKGIRSLPRSSDPQAYELYLKSRALTGSHLPAQSRQQVEMLRRALSIDNEFAAAHADLAIALSLRRARGFVDDDDGADAEWHARQAVRLDPNLPEAHLALGRTLARDPERYRESVRESLAALRLNPHDPHALYTMVTYFVATGEIDKARCVGDVFVSIDPSSNDARTRGYWNVNAVDPEGSLTLSSLALATKETELAGYDIRALSHLALGNYAAARSDQRRAAALVPDHYIGKSLAALIAATAGDRNRVGLELGRMQHDLERNHWAALRAALAYARLGDRAAAIEWTRRAAALGNQSWFFLNRHPWMAPLQEEPEFQQIVTRMKTNLDDVRDDILGVYGLICTEPALQPNR
jgi:eukaryotic-like serine/threonine-protein kinase